MGGSFSAGDGRKVVELVLPILQQFGLAEMVNTG
jgi:hypothetical protein